jgi:enamine deaminase RidA (YjgF/YER057c/UK114 family)
LPASPPRRSIIIIRIGRRSSTPCRAAWPGRRARRSKISSAGSKQHVVTATRFVTDLSDQDALNRVWAEYFGDAKPATTTVQVVRLATDPRCLVEINAVAVVD